MIEFMERPWKRTMTAMIDTGRRLHHNMLMPINRGANRMMNRVMENQRVGVAAIRSSTRG